MFLHAVNSHCAVRSSTVAGEALILTQANISYQGDAHLCPAAANQISLLASLHVAAAGADIAVAVGVPVCVLAVTAAARVAASPSTLAFAIVPMLQAPPSQPCMHAEMGQRFRAWSQCSL